MAQQLKTETSLQSEFQNIDEYSKSCIDFFSSIISKDDLNSKEILSIKQIISNSLELGYVNDSISSKITDILSSSTLLTGYSFRNNYLQLFPSLESIFDSRNSFYTNNSNNKNPSFPWTIVVDNFIRSANIESILDCLNVGKIENLSCEHFFCLAKILNSISSRIEKAKYRDILNRILKSLSTFLMSSESNNPNDFVQLYSIYFKLSSGVLLTSDEYNVFLSLSNKAFKVQLLENFGCQQAINLLRTPAKNLMITQEYCDFILSLNLTNENTKILSTLYILFAQNNLINLTNLESLNKQRKSLIIEYSSNYIHPTILKPFIQKENINTVNLPLFIQFIKQSNDESLIKSTLQKVLLFGDNENTQENVNNKFLPLLTSIQLLPILYEELTLFSPASKTSLCSHLLEKIRSKTLEDGNCFIAQIRSVKTINQLQNLIEIASKENRNQSVLDQFEKCHVFEILCNDLLNNRFGAEGIYLILTLFHSYSSSLLIFIINKLVPNLLQVFAIEGNDKLFNENLSLLTEIYDLAPDETLTAIELNIKSLTQSIQKVHPSIFSAFKKFIVDLDDKIFFSLFLYSKNEEGNFSELYKEFNLNLNQKSAQYYHKILLILCQLDDESFGKLYKHLLANIDGQILDQNAFIVDSLLNMTLITHSEKVLSLIFDSFDYLSSLSNLASKSIDDFIVKISSIKLSDFNVSRLNLEQSNSGMKVLVSDRSDVSSILQVLYRMFPFNLFAFSSTETRFYANSVSMIQLLFHEMSLCEQKFIDSNELTKYFVKLSKDPAIVFKSITKACPQNWIHEFQGKIKDDEDDFVCLTVSVNDIKSLNIVKTPPVLVLQLNRKSEGEIEVPIRLIFNDEKIEYNLTALVILDPLTNEFDSVIKDKENWIKFTQKDVILNDIEINEEIKNSYLVFYTRYESTVDEPINNALTTLYIEHPFNIIECINGPTSLENISKKNEYFRIKFSVLNETTIKFMIDKSDPITLFSYLIHSICHSDQQKYVEIATEKITNNLKSDEIIQYIETNFNTFVCTLSNSPYSNSLIKIISHSIQHNSSEQNLIQLIIHFLNRLTKIEYKELNPLSMIISKFVFYSNRNLQFAQRNNWHQKLISVLHSVFNYNRKYEYLRNLDLSPLFDTLSILITTEFIPNDIYYLFNISEQVFISKKHNQSYITLLYKLKSLNIIKSESNTNQIISYVNSFQSIIDKSEVPEIPSLLNASKIFKEISSQVESGNENLRSNILKVFLPKLFSYLDDEDKEVRDEAQHLIYVLLGYPQKDVYEPAIKMLISSLKDGSDCSARIDFLFDLIKKSESFDDDYLRSAFDGIRSSKDVSLLLNYIVKKSNDTIGQPEVNQFYLDSIVGLSDSVVNSGADLSDPFEIDLNETIAFFDNFWPGLPSDKLILLLNKIAGQNKDFLADFRQALIDQMSVQVEPDGSEKWQLAIVCNELLLNNRDSLSLGSDEDLANEMKRIHDLACLEHKKVPDSNPHFLFAQYLDELIENPGASWIPNFASKILPESRMSSEEEKEFFRLALSDNKEKEVEEKADELRNKIEKSKQDKLNKDKLRNERKHRNENSIKERSTSDNSSPDQSTLNKSKPGQSSSDKSSPDQSSLNKSKPGQSTTDKSKSDQSSSDKSKLGQPTSDSSKLCQSSSDKSEPGQSSSDKSRPDQPSSDMPKQGQPTSDRSKLGQSPLDKSKPGQSTSDRSKSSDKPALDQPSSDKSKPNQSTSDKSKADQSSSDKSRNPSGKPGEDSSSANERSISSPLQSSSDKPKSGQSTPGQLNNASGMPADASNSASGASNSDKSNLDQPSADRLGNEDGIPIIDPSSIKERSTEVVEEEEEADEADDGQHHKEEAGQIKVRKPGSELSALEMETRQLNSLLYGDDDDDNDDKIDQRDDIGDFNMEEFNDDLNELEDSTDTATATATALGTAAITTASYLLYKYMKKK